MFDRAVVIGAMTSARGYLTPALATQSPPMELPVMLGVPNIPRSAYYTIDSVNSRHATVDVTYRLATSSVRDRLSIVRVRSLWRIAEIKRA